MNKKYIVKLTPDEREMLQQLIASGKASARKLTHARILLKADSTSSAGPNWSDQAISNALDISLSTIARVRQRFVEEGVSAALTSRRRSYRRSPILDGEAEAHLIAVACSEPPHGYGHWTLRLLADEMVEREYVESVSYETVRRTFKKTNLSRG